MLQSALLGLTISLLADVLPIGPTSRIDVAAGARAELSVGRVPVTSRADSAPGTEETVVVRSGVRLISPTSSLSLVYSPQYYLRLPDALEVGRPLLLHDGTLSWAARLNRRLSFSWVLRSSAGELPNSGLLAVFEPGTSTVSASVVPIFRINTSLGMNALTGKRQTTSATLSGSHNDSLGSEENSPILESDNLNLLLSHSIALSARTSAGISGQVGYIDREDQESAIMGGQLFLSQRVLPSAVVRLAAGVSQGWALGGAMSVPLPTLDVGYRTRFTATGQSWSLNLSGGTRAFFDAASASYRPQVFVVSGVSGRILQTWTVASTLSVSADVSGSDPNASTGDPALGLQPTQFNFNVPIAYRIDENLQLNFGLRLGLSGPPITAFSEGSFQDQVSVFVALDWRTGTERTRGSWL